MTHDYNIPHTAKTSALHRALLLAICFILSFTTTSLAQTIGGNVFGGGNQGDVNQSSTVELRGGIIQGDVFGGGNEAEVKSSTSVTISGGELKRNVYGAGNQGNVGSSSTVTLEGGTIMGNVYGGAREADVAGRTFVDVNATSTLLVSGVYGGNDVSGTIGKSGALPFTPSLLDVITTEWNSFVRIANNTSPVIIGSLYGGGNGAYDVYTGNKTKPELGKTYLEIQGGIFGNIYGGGNNATVTGNTVIYMNNQLANLSVSEATLGDFKDLFDATDYSTNGENITFNHHVSRMFGGNNLAEMAIRPTWNLIKGSINNLYSGGNRGAMTNENGILLPLTSADLTVNNVYGGCRIADVDPGTNVPGEDITIQDYTFPAGYATRVYITAGNINNVYGGNDISGKVHYGTNLAIFSNITGDVYGGGNGSYAYTDNSAWVTAHPEDADYYYEPSTSSVDALFNFRPHIEKTLIHVEGKDAAKPITLGSVYCGGNSATLYKDGTGDAAAKFRIGKNVTIGNVFLGSNGANMVSEEMLTQYAGDTYNSINLTEQNQFNRYMDGVAVDILPNIEWEEGLDYTTRIGSFFCGGNIGSMKYAGVAKTGNNKFFEFPAGITITEKIVAGCNNANIAAVDNLNAAYEGGLTGTYESGTNDKVRIKVLSRLEPTSTKTVSYQDAEGVLQENKSVYQGANVYGGCYKSGVVNGNVVIDVESDIVAPDLEASILKATGDYIDASALAIYGGGFGTDAVIKGNTQINLTNNARVLFVFGGGEMGEVTGNTTVKLDNNLNFTTYQNAYKVYAGGYAGPVDGNTTLNLLGGSVMSAFAGACNANIGGTTEAIIGAGTHGVPYVTHAVYGGNDFGGHIGVNNTSSKLYENITVPGGTKNVRTQTYVKYVSGKIGRAIYGGSYGSYAYDNQDIYGGLINHIRPTINATVSKQDGDPEGTILTNTFVDIASTSTSSDDIIGSDNSESVLTMIAGGGRGYKGLPDYVEVGRTYLLLHGATYANRNNQLMAHRVYGGGNLSKVGSTRIDAYSGSFGAIFGGTHGVKTAVAGDLAASYDCANTTINYYGTMGSANMNLFGTGANSGATGTATINLYAGDVGNVYGGSLAEGYTAVTSINVPNSSNKVIANAIFGGALGESEGRPCDVGVSNIVFESAIARVNEGIYGGNHTARATKETNVTINVPVKNQYENLLSIYGAGYGAGTVAGSTHVTLNAGAEVANVYGGGREGKVYNAYNHYDTSDAFAKYSNNGRHAKWQINDYTQNTLVEINGTSEKIAHVTGNVYGAGLGIENVQNGLPNANTCGKTKVRLLGGTVDGDIYGGGYAGTMLSLDDAIDYDANIGTLCDIQGGQVRNVFGGGYQGKIEGNSGVSIGSTTPTTDTPFFGGVPTILRSAYGGGEMAVVNGTSTVDMYNGYIGYRYHADAPEDNKYQPELKLNADDEANLLIENGNLYGAGFGEGAVVMNTQVRLYGGTIRNGLYGGGEIAAVGKGHRNNDGTYTVNTGGQTNVYMYGGLVVGDVFGGGRGYSYDLTGNQVIGKTLYSDGYVFGKTNVEIYRGTIGTDESLALGHGNVFGGGNIGYVYSAGVKYTGDTDGTKIKGHYYTNDNYTKRTEDCRVHIAAGALVTANSVTINSHPYSTGEFVHNAVLNTLAYDADAWSRLDNEGVTIRNAVFAGGNVSAGSDKVYANAVTVFGNATAAVVDVFSKDLVTLGGEHVGGLYGDGNLTFVDGYRELNITNYGTDYYRLEKELENETYNTKYNNGSPLTPELEREKAYYTYDATNNKWVINTTSGRTMNTIQRADFCGVFGSRFLLHGAQDRVPDEVDYTNYTINRVGEVSLNTKTVDGTTHGNYFGIYNVVNELGALTSNVEFNNAKEYPHQYITTDAEGNTTTEIVTSKDSEGNNISYLDYKKANINNSDKNIAISSNMVALASGVFLELSTTDPTTMVKSYGPITGVIELDLLNVQPGEGGGYVYAKNEHRSPNSVNKNDKKQLTLSTANEGAITQKAFTYGDKKEAYQTSGNFVHAKKPIIDDCFPQGELESEVHYWFVSGKRYVYDQKISAYTGAVDTRSQSLNIPLTINKTTPHTIKIVDIKSNKYFVGTNEISSITFGNKVYQLNDPITYWDWTNLPNGHKNYFVDMTYIAQEAKGNYKQGDVISEEIYNTLSDEDKGAFRITNEMSYQNGYLLTFEMTNPIDWGSYYTKGTTTELGSKLDNKDEYEKAPTIQCNESGIYGQIHYEVENLIGQDIYNEHSVIVNSPDEDVKSAYNAVKNDQANFEEAYYVSSPIQIGEVQYSVGSYVAASKLTDDQKNIFKPAYLCVNTIEVSKDEFLLKGDWISETRYDELKLSFGETSFSKAYVCTKEGLYGGKFFKEDENLTAEEFCDLPYTERNKMIGETAVFTFNQDALDVFSPRHERYSEVEQVTATPTQTATLYVPRESSIENLSEERIISVILQYNVSNSEEEAETHVVNIHVEFKSGQPTIGNIVAPATVLPNTIVGLSTPTVTRGAYEIIGGGWEIFKNEADARAHKNGEPYRNNTTPMYWYQDGYHVAYYAKTYLGKTYSNPVKFSVANYHRLSEVMNHTVNNENGEPIKEYMYIDHEEVKRAPKIYLDAAGSESTEKNDLDYLVDLYDVTLQETTETTTNDAGEEVSVTIREVDERIKGCANLEFILRSDIAPKTYRTWTSVGSQTTPFAGTFHGNGYTISVLNNASLFGHLGGKVYNLGVNGGNIASTMANGGRIENVWVSATTPIELSGANVVNYHFLTNENAASFAKGEVAYKLNSFYAPNVQYDANGYVEKYFADGDFIYADGAIPLRTDDRYQNGQYKPLVDDYIFFGQRLTYDNVTHESLPNRINKVDNAIDRTANSDRVYRASAYYQSKEEKKGIFFNTDAKFVDTYDSKPIHQNLTAIDFTDSEADMEQLLGFSLGDGLTKNLLVYAQIEEGENTSYGKISSYLNETALSISTDGYQTVAKNGSPSRGHLVTKKDGNSYVALTDHFLVDKENFNVPIEYKFDSDKRMWYQREPDRFAVAGNGNGDGWDIICLPFTAELVTTHQKGEITHFYQGSTTMHEYWLRELKSVATEDTKTKATFASPAADDAADKYTAYSTFLYDTYYMKKNDANADSYQQNHYASAREYVNYAYLQANTPYIIAFPGQSYHEFDMSGNFVPGHTATSIGKLDEQVVTFVSEVGATIGVTDDATLDKTAGGYNFVGTYQIKDINGYLINTDGSAFVEANEQSSVPFRGYLTTTASGAPKRIFISGAAEEEEPAEDVIERGLTIYSKDGAIYVESTLEHEATLTIHTMSGQVVKRITLQPMSKEVIPVTSRGIYLVNQKKVAVL